MAMWSVKSPDKTQPPKIYKLSSCWSKTYSIYGCYASDLSIFGDFPMSLQEIITRTKGDPHTDQPTNPYHPWDERYIYLDLQ